MINTDTIDEVKIAQKALAFERNYYGEINEKTVDKLTQAVNRLLEEESNPLPKDWCFMGVGNGDGDHFVYGDWESIKMAQDKILGNNKSKPKPPESRYMYESRDTPEPLPGSLKARKYRGDRNDPNDPVDLF